MCPPNYQFDIIRKEQRECSEDIWEVVDENEKQEWPYHGGLWVTTVHWNGSRVKPCVLIGPPD